MNTKFINILNKHCYYYSEVISAMVKFADFREKNLSKVEEIDAIIYLGYEDEYPYDLEVGIHYYQISNIMYVLKALAYYNQSDLEDLLNDCAGIFYDDYKLSTMFFINLESMLVEYSKITEEV